MVVTPVLLIAIIALFCIFRRKRLQHMTVFKELGIPGPTPNFLFGNLLEFQKVPLFKKYQEWKEEYGETFGYFEGPTPVLVTSDVNILQEVFIKQFDHFHARKLWPVQVDPDKDEDVHMFFARGRRWKRLRTVVNPAFSAAKIKKMTPTVNECINHLLDVIKDQSKIGSDRTIELLDLFRRLTLDTILRCEIGIEQNSVKNAEDPFLKHCKGVIEDTTKMPWLYLLGFIFPNLHCIWIRIYKFLHNFKFNPVFWLEDRMRDVVVLRKSLSDKRCNDLMQQMLSAQLPVDSFHEIEKEAASAIEQKKYFRAMTNEEIVSHSLLFLLAGYETTSTTLGYIFYELSQNPAVQQRLRHELMAVLSRGYEEIDYADLKKLTYLDYVIWETLRKYPLASTVTARQCMKDCTVGGIDIPSGMLVHANLWDVQNDPQHWGADPHVFNPLRFLPDKRKQRHPTAWMPFGAGPRSCAGLRFAMLQLKMVVAKILRDFDIHPSDAAGHALTLRQGATILPTDGINLSVWRRASAISVSSRRGSSFSVDNLPTWASQNQRKASLTKDSTCGEESDASMDESMESFSARSRKSFMYKGSSESSVNNRRESFFEDDEPDAEIVESLTNNRSRKDSLTQGLELLRRDSVSRCINMLRRVSSIGMGNDSKVQDSDTDQSTEDTSSNKYPRLKTNHVIPKSEHNLEWISGFSTMPDDILGDLPFPRARKNSRRSSVRPNLESVSEIESVGKVFNKPLFSKLSSISRRGSFTQTQNGTNIMELLYKRRVSG